MFQLFVNRQFIAYTDAVLDVDDENLVRWTSSFGNAGRFAAATLPVVAVTAIN